MNQIENNPFPFSSTNKRYHTFTYAMQQRFNQKVAKIPLNAHFTCPNRDGNKGIGGCRFCTRQGSGDTILGFSQPLTSQYEQNLARARQKWPQCVGMPYFQAYSNTYAPLPVLQKLYEPFLEDPDTPALAIATRTDCLEEEAAAWLGQYAKDKDIWLEFGLQTIHASTSQAMNLCHTPKQAAEVVGLCKKYGLKTCLHLINGLPGETPEMMVETARFAARLKPDAVKLHMLHVMENSDLGEDYQASPFSLLSLEEYVQIVCDQLEILPADIIIERISGDGQAEQLIGPLWTVKKTAVANAVDKELFARNSWQGKYAPLEISQEHPWTIETCCYLPEASRSVRTQVFIQEQGFDHEFDDLDSQSVHLVLFDQNQAVGTLRLLEQPDKVWRIGRVAVLPDQRHKKAGTTLMKAAEKWIQKKGGSKIELHAQISAIPFYESLGYTGHGPIEPDEHVLHQWMTKSII